MHSVQGGDRVPADSFACKHAGVSNIIAKFFIETHAQVLHKYYIKLLNFNQVKNAPFQILFN